MAASPVQPRSIMRSLNGFYPSTPSRRAAHEQDLSRSLTLQDTVQGVSVTRRSVRFSPAPSAVFEMHSPLEYDRRVEDGSPSPTRTGHLDSTDLFRFRAGLRLPEMTPHSAVDSSRGPSPFTLDDPFEDALDESDEEDAGTWRSGTPQRVRPIAALQLDSPGSDSEDEGIRTDQAGEPAQLSTATHRSPAAINGENDENRAPAIVLASSSSDMSIPRRESIWLTPSALETRSRRFEDHVGDIGIDEHVNMDITMPSKSPRIAASAYNATAASSSPITPSRRSSPRPPLSPSLHRQTSVPHVPSTPTRFKNSSPRSPVRPALSSRENFPHIGTTAKLTRQFRMRLLQSRGNTLSETGLGVISEDHDEE